MAFYRLFSVQKATIWSLPFRMIFIWVQAVLPLNIVTASSMYVHTNIYVCVSLVCACLTRKGKEKTCLVRSFILFYNMCSGESYNCAWFWTVMKWYLLRFSSFTGMVSEGNVTNIITEYMTKSNLKEEKYCSWKLEVCKAYNCPPMRGNVMRKCYC